jgi:hypothetical protein
LYDRNTPAKELDLLGPFDQSKDAYVLSEAELMNGPQTAIDVFGIPFIGRVSGANDVRDVERSPGTQQGQRLEEFKMVLVLPELVADEDKLVREMVPALGLQWISLIPAIGRKSPEMQHLSFGGRGGIKALVVRRRILTAKDNGSGVIKKYT